MKLTEWYWTLYGLLSYDILLLFLPYQELLEEEIGISKLERGMRIFDAGCGTGNLIWKIASRLPDLQIIGGDFTNALLGVAKTKLALTTKKENISVGFREIDINNLLPFPDNSFDRIFCSNVLYALDNPDAALKEFNRVLKNNGKLILVNPPKSYKENAPFVDHMKRASFIRKLALIPFLPILILLKIFNIINQRNKDWHFYSSQELVRKIKNAAFDVDVVKNVYSGIGTLVLATRMKEGE